MRCIMSHLSNNSTTGQLPEYRRIPLGFVLKCAHLRIQSFDANLYPRKAFSGFRYRLGSDLQAGGSIPVVSIGNWFFGRRLQSEFEKLWSGEKRLSGLLDVRATAPYYSPCSPGRPPSRSPAPSAR